jgi:hypothetical protein
MLAASIELAAAMKQKPADGMDCRTANECGVQQGKEG